MSEPQRDRNPAFETLPDEELARQAQAGSLASFEELVYRHEGRLFRFLARCCACPADAADLTQETFVAAYLNLGRYNPAQSFATWLFVIARRKHVDYLRARRPAAAEPLAPEPRDEDDPAELLARREGAEALWRWAQSVLAPVQFQALWLKYAEEMSVAEIALVLRRTRIHVKVILFRARSTLASRLERRSGYGNSSCGPGPEALSRVTGRALA